MHSIDTHTHTNSFHIFMDGMDGQCQLGLYKLAGAPTRTPMASAGSGHGRLVNLLALISVLFFCMDDAYNYIYIYIYTRIIIYIYI